MIQGVFSSMSTLSASWMEAILKHNDEMKACKQVWTATPTRRQGGGVQRGSSCPRRQYLGQYLGCRLQVAKCPCGLGVCCFGLI